MPLITIGLLQQQQAASSGIKVYPAITQALKDSTMQDQFLRETLTPTDAFLLYTTAVTGTGTATIDAEFNQLKVRSSATIGHDVDTRTSGLNYFRKPTFIDNRSRLELDIIFQGGETTSSEGFVGLLNVAGAITALPTTVVHLGLFWDVSVTGDDYLLSSANGTTQVTTATGVGLASFVRLNISWTGDNAGVLTLFSGSNFDVSEATQTVTSLSANDWGAFLHFFIQSEAASTRTVVIEEWRAKWT